MFLREVTVGTINYAGQESGAILGIKDLIPNGMKVLFLLEEKQRRNEYPEDWVLLRSLSKISIASSIIPQDWYHPVTQWHAKQLY